MVHEFVENEPDNLSMVLLDCQFALVLAILGAAISPIYYIGAGCAIVLLFLVVHLAFHREIEKEG